MLVELLKSKEKCINCNQELGNTDFFYRHKATGGYICSKCGFYYLYENGVDKK